jgi:hypothetical protein
MPLEPMAARLLALVLLLAPAAARADSPIREGGTGRPFSLSLAAGAAVPSTAATAPVAGPRTFVELTAAWWASETFQGVASVGWRGPDRSLELLAGPAARSGFYPMSVSLALQLGAVIAPGGTTHPVLVPRLGADLRLGNHALVGMGYAIDLRLDTMGIVHCVYLDLGWRF